MKKIKFKDLSQPLQFGIVGGIVSLILNIIDFAIGFVYGVSLWL